MITQVGISYDRDRIANGKFVVEAFTSLQRPGVANNFTVVLSFHDFVNPNTRLWRFFHGFTVTNYTVELSHGPILTG
jgi:hypothetical protein